MIAKEDCDSRKRFQDETAGTSDAEMEESSEEEGGDMEDVELGEQETELSEYEQNRQKNIEDLKKRLHSLKKEILESTKAKSVPKKRKKGPDVPDEPVRRESLRKKNKTRVSLST